MSWFTLLTTGLKILNTIIQWANRRNLITLGKQQEIARQTADFLRSAGINDEIIATVVNKTPEELDAALEERFID